MSNLNKYTIKQVKTACMSMFNSKDTRNIPINIMGPPGIGKTDLFEQLALEWKADYKVFLTATMDPTDVVGIPHESDGVTTFCPPKDWMALTEDCIKVGVSPDIPIVAVLEDFPACAPSVFNALLRVLCNGEVAGSKIRNNVLLGATGNSVEDRAGAAQLTTAIANRFMHFQLKVDSDEWVLWATRNGVNPYIISFIERTGESSLHSFDASSGFLAFPTPRSVVRASHILSTVDINDDVSVRMVLEGCCGSGWAQQFITFFKLREKVISIKSIFDNPKTAKVPKETDTDIMYCTVNNVIHSCLSSYTTEKAKALLIYLNRIPQEEITMFALKRFLDTIMSGTSVTEEQKAEVIAMTDEWGPLMNALTDLAKDAYLGD